MDLNELAKNRSDARRTVRTFIDKAKQGVVAAGIPEVKQTISAMETVLALSLGSDAETHQIMLEAMTEARRSLLLAIQNNIDPSLGLDPNDNLIIKTIDAAISRAKGGV